MKHNGDLEMKAEEIKEEIKEQSVSSSCNFSAEWEDRVRRSILRPGYLPQPAPTGCLPFMWMEHAKLLIGPTSDGVDAAKSVFFIKKITILHYYRASEWNTDQVCSFIQDIPGLEHQTVASKLREEEVDGEALLSLTQFDLTSILDVKLGPAIKIFHAITAVRMRS